jgi:hypothetical protein
LNFGAGGAGAGVGGTDSCIISSNSTLNIINMTREGIIHFVAFKPFEKNSWIFPSHQKGDRGGAKIK